MAGTAETTETAEVRAAYEAEGWQFHLSSRPDRILMCRPKGQIWHEVGDDECDCIARSFGKLCSHLKALLELGDVASMRANLQLQETYSNNGHSPKGTELS